MRVVDRYVHAVPADTTSWIEHLAKLAGQLRNDHGDLPGDSLEQLATALRLVQDEITERQRWLPAARGTQGHYSHAEGILHVMTAAHPHPDLHELVDQLSPAQADAVRAVVLQLVAPTATNSGETLPRQLAFIGTLEAEPDFAERSEEILDEIVRRNAG